VNSIKKSNLHLPNNFCRSFLEALDDLAGKNGVSTVLNLASLRNWGDAYPPDDLEKQIDFADFSGINQSLEEVYGISGGRSLSRQAGGTIFDDSLMPAAGMAEALEGAQADQPSEERFHLVIKTLVDLFNEISDIKSTYEISQNGLRISISACPVCWGRRTTSPACFALLGIIERGLILFAGGTEFLVLEDQCIATGDSECGFTIHQTPQQ